MLYRITGPQSIDRLEPLVPRVIPKAEAWKLETSSGSPQDTPPGKKIDFVWETTCELTMRERHSQATVLNKLHNVVILEDKANLAFLQTRMDCPVLETYVANGSEEVKQWGLKRWAGESKDAGGSVDGDWWVVKASAGNGGKDIWVMTSNNVDSVVAELPMGDVFVIQKYVARPMLWKGTKKFHFRCYSVLRANLSALVYRMAYILTAGYNYNQRDDSTTSESAGADTMDPRRLITNLSVNKAIPNHPGQVPCHVQREYPGIYENICSMWREVARACEPFMLEQVSPHHFEFFGIDIIADRDGVCWLLEVNRLPGLEASLQNKVQEDAMYDEMMLDLLRVVLVPVGAPAIDSNPEVGVGMWDVVTRAGPTSDGKTKNEDVMTFKNTFSWRAFTKKKEIREKIVIGAGAGAGAGEKKLKDGKEASSVFQRSEGIAKAMKQRSNEEEKVTQCGVQNCQIQATLRCSRCKQASYCGKEHQRQDWAFHKRSCKPPSSSTHRSSGNSDVSDGSTTSPRAAAPRGGEARQSRCMFCGDTVVMQTEEDAHRHMTACPALQEQLNSSDQFTIPKVLRDKGVTMADVKRQQEQDERLM